MRGGGNSSYSGYEIGAGEELNLKSCFLHYKFIFYSIVYFKEFLKFLREV
jgi:hypothetical protein